MNVKYSVKLLDEYWIGNYVELSGCGLIYGNCCPGTSLKVLSRTRGPADTITVNVFIFSEYFMSQEKILTPTAPTFGLLSTDLLSHTESSFVNFNPECVGKLNESCVL